MNPLTTETKIIGSLVLAGLLFGAGFGAEYKNMVAYKAEQKGITEAQTTEVKRLNTLIDTNAKDSNENIMETAQSIHAYYKLNPIIRVSHDGSCTMPQAIGNSGSSNDPSSTYYASPYTPESTELVANQLDLLIKLLYNDGVEIK